MKSARRAFAAPACPSCWYSALRRRRPSSGNSFSPRASGRCITVSRKRWFDSGDTHAVLAKRAAPHRIATPKASAARRRDQRSAGHGIGQAEGICGGDADGQHRRDQQRHQHRKVRDRAGGKVHEVENLQSQRCENHRWDEDQPRAEQGTTLLDGPRSKRGDDVGGDSAGAHRDEREISRHQHATVVPTVALPPGLGDLDAKVPDGGVDQAIDGAGAAKPGGQPPKSLTPEAHSAGLSRRCATAAFQAPCTRTPNGVASYRRRGSPPASGAGGVWRDVT